MKILFFVFLIALFKCKVSATCDSAKQLPDLERRARNYNAAGDYGNDQFVDDEYLGPDWFSVGNYKMPDSNYKPEYSFCGTQQPIYIKGTHPDIATLTADSPVALTACEYFPFDDCLNERSIEVRKCGDDLQYYLVLTSGQSAYCMDPPLVQNVTDFADAPTNVNIGTLIVTPKLDFKVTGDFELPYNKYECTMSSNGNNAGLFYSTYWFVGSEVIKAFEGQTEVMALTDDDLLENSQGFGVSIQCGVRVSASVTGFQTDIVTSQPFFVGVKVTPDAINMDKSETVTITLQPTIPFGCYARIGDEPTGKCAHSINMYYPEVTDQLCNVDITAVGSLPKVNSKQAICGVEIQGYYPYQIQQNPALTSEAVTMNVTSTYFSDSDPTSYKLALITKNAGTHKIWKQAALNEIQVIIETSPQYTQKLCYAHIDPHMFTGDGLKYEHNSKDGNYILYKHMDNGIEVQIRTTLCNRNRAFCVCAVSVRAGGDVFLINLCGGLRFVGMTSCKDGGILVIQQYSHFNYQIQTTHGTLIKVLILSGSYANLMNVDIHLAPRDYQKVLGLCGTFDGNRNNDFHDRNQNIVSRTAFIDAWELTANDINMLDPTCSLPVETWQEAGQQLYCVCDCFGADSDCGTPETTATCSASQYANCTVNLNKNTELCTEYADRCKSNVVAKRSVLDVDPELEMKRLAKRARLPHRYIAKRQDITITTEQARTHCTDVISTDAITKNSGLLGGFNLTHAIDDCTWDVETGQDPGWADTHRQAVESAIAAGYKRNADYTLSHLDDLKEFSRQACPYDCSGNGVCLENGACNCNSQYFGPDCSMDKSQGLSIEDVEGGGLCDQRNGSECNCFSVQVEALTETFKCKMVMKKVLENGAIETAETSDTSGQFQNFYNGKCCYSSGRRKRSEDTNAEVLYFLYELSLSNDDVNYGPESTIYLFDSSCIQTHTAADGNVTFSIKDNTCIINGVCYEAGDVDLYNEHNTCSPNDSKVQWTNDGQESGQEDDQDDAEEKSDDDGIPLLLMIVLTVCGVIILSVIVGVVIYIKKSHSTRAVHASQDFTMIREQSRTSYNNVRIMDL